MKKYLILSFLFTCLTIQARENKIKYNEVVERLIDLKVLASIPEPGEKSAMWSSMTGKVK